MLRSISVRAMGENLRARRGGEACGQRGRRRVCAVRKPADRGGVRHLEPLTLSTSSKMSPPDTSSTGSSLALRFVPRALLCSAVLRRE